MPISQVQKWIGLSKYPSKYRMIENGDVNKTLLYTTSDQNCEVIIICGTFFMMKEAKSFFQP